MFKLCSFGSKLLVAGVLFFFGREDLRHRRVQNTHLLFFILLCVALVWANGRFSVSAFLWWVGTTALFYLLVGFKLIGAGDFKVVTASALYGYMVEGYGFFLSFLVLFGLDQIGSILLRRQGKKEAPLLWFWAWAFLLREVIALFTIF